MYFIAILKLVLQRKKEKNKLVLFLLLLNVVVADVVMLANFQ